MTAKISMLTTCTITLVTALTNLTPLEARTMEGDFTSNQEEISQTISASGPDRGGHSGCIWIPGIIGPWGDCDHDD